MGFGFFIVISAGVTFFEERDKNVKQTSQPKSDVVLCPKDLFYENMIHQYMDDLRKELGGGGGGVGGGGGGVGGGEGGGGAGRVGSASSNKNGKSTAAASAAADNDANLDSSGDEKQLLLTKENRDRRASPDSIFEGASGRGGGGGGRGEYARIEHHAWNETNPHPKEDNFTQSKGNEKVSKQDRLWLISKLNLKGKGPTDRHSILLSHSWKSVFIK